MFLSKASRVCAAIPGARAEPRPGNISGTVTDANNDIVPGASIALDNPSLGIRRVTAANDSGAFDFDSVKPGGAYRVTISADGFVNWISPEVTVEPGDFVFPSDVKIEIEGGITSVTVRSSTEQISVEQVNLEEKQRVFGIIPNYYVVYDRDAFPIKANDYTATWIGGLS